MKPDTYTGNTGLCVEEPTIFELGSSSNTGVDFPALPDSYKPSNSLSPFIRKDPVDLPGLSEPEAIRHYTRLSQKNFGIDTGFFPLGSCTMKHNPRLNEKLARLEGFSQTHPLQRDDSVQGILQLMWLVGYWLKELTGMHSVALSPAAGAQGEMCGMFLIKEALRHKGELDKRTTVLVPDSAHGTNPATATMCGFTAKSIPSTDKGLINVDALKDALDDTVAALMLTNPNTCGLFECNTLEISKLLKKNGTYYYCDGANFNALLGQVKPADLGIDVMHINLHKTFSTPHGGGGPGSGPVVMTEELSQFSPISFVDKLPNGQFELISSTSSPKAVDSFGRLKAFQGQIGMFIRTYAYMLSHGIDGLTQVSNDAVLNANYIKNQLKDVLHIPFDQPCLHEVLFDDSTLRALGLETLDLAKVMQDEGFHPMTTYFPLIVKGAMLVEPTETESKAQIDQFIAAIRYWLKKAETEKGRDRIRKAPLYTPRRRFDETATARSPELTWK